MKLVASLGVEVVKVQASWQDSVVSVVELSVVMAARESERLCREKVVILIVEVVLLVIVEKVRGCWREPGDYRQLVVVFAYVLAVAVVDLPLLDSLG